MLGVLPFRPDLAHALFLAGADTARIEARGVAVTDSQGLAEVAVDADARLAQARHWPPDGPPFSAFAVLGSEDSRDLERLTFLQRPADVVISGRTALAGAVRRPESGGAGAPAVGGVRSPEARLSPACVASSPRAPCARRW
ncbi:hypothetical protein [Streptomyces sp. NEAU-H3]|uniref:hypothetical protein n=1 Tax=Streptomyces sp. NEAU-H3 TaxID=2720636 RepID=UPI001ADC805C|nr:hypothetical protein [Streptomyces sp. NEAU-H3]